MDESFDPLKCNEDLPSSPGCNMDYGKNSKPIRSHILYFVKQIFQVLILNVIVVIPSDDMPDLQEVEEDQRSPGFFQVGSGVSHQEFSCSPNTNWLAELANIATSPQSPLLKNIPHKRFGVCIYRSWQHMYHSSRPYFTKKQCKLTIESLTIF